MRFNASSILRISLRSRSRVRSSRLNSSSWVARSFGSGKFAASSFMCVTVRSTSTMRSRFQLLRMKRKCSSCCLLMYCSPRLTMYGCTLRGPASRLPGSMVSPSSPSAFAAGAAAERFALIIVAVAGGGAVAAPARGAFLGSPFASPPAPGTAGSGFFGAAEVLRACATAALTRTGSALRPTAFLTAGRLVAFLPFADLGAGLLAGIKGSSNSISLVKDARLYRPTPGCTGVLARAARRFVARSLGQRDGGRGSPGLLSSLGDNGGVDSAAHVEARGQPQEARLQCGLQMIGNLVGHGLVIRAAVTKRPDVQLQGFQFHAHPVGHVLEVERREVRLPGARTQAGELGDLHADRVVIGSGVGERLELRCGPLGHIPLHYTILEGRPGRKQSTMRLTKIKLAGFKSFVDPTQISFPSNLTGVVGPNGCGKSNVIDAVRWVMGELSAKTLRGDNMADVVFNGSAARKPVGSASVELVFDNADGKIGGAYANYSEISLKRQVARDDTSAYFINSVRCRRKDITNLFLGTGLGSRSYAIIEQGMISRVIEAKSDDMRAFIEEAASISRYKERRKETESRVADTRENLERLQDLRDEIEKQIRHLQRQAATARRYQAFKEQERRLTAELLALRLRDLDGGAEVHDSAMRERELSMQAALADQRAAEAAIEKQRAFHTEQSDSVSAVQGRYYEIGAEISRLEQTIQHTRELRERQRTDLAQAHSTLTDLATHIERDERQLTELRDEIARLAPEIEGVQLAEGAAAESLDAAERQLQDWQQRWEQFNRALGSAGQTTQVERARIEQLENQLRRHTAQADRLALERDALAAHDSSEQLALLTEQEANARTSSDELNESLKVALEQVQSLRAEQLSAEKQLEAARGERERARAEQTSLEALQKAALTHDAGSATEWLAGAGLTKRPRVAETLEVQRGWERAVETALGDYLEAVCVEGLDELAGALGSLAKGRVALVEAGDGGGPCDSASCDKLPSKLRVPPSR